MTQDNNNNNEFKLENKYLVIKRKDLDKFMVVAHNTKYNCEDYVRSFLKSNDVPLKSGLFIDESLPIYDEVLALLSNYVTTRNDRIIHIDPGHPDGDYTGTHGS